MWDSLLSFLSLEKEIPVFLFFITSRVLKVVLMVSTVHEHGFVQSRHPGCSF